jgi:hypothetical protein
MGTTEFAMIEILLIYQTGTQSAADGCATLVVSQPVPRHARQATMPGMHQFVICYPSDRVEPSINKARNQTAFATLGGAHPCPE